MTGPAPNLTPLMEQGLEGLIAMQLERRIRSDDVPALAERKQVLLNLFGTFSPPSAATLLTRIRSRAPGDDLVRLLYRRVSRGTRAEVMKALTARCLRRRARSITLRCRTCRHRALTLRIHRRFPRGAGRFSVDDLAMVALPEPDPDERAALLQRAVDAAHAADRREELAMAPARAREQLFRAWSRRGYEPSGSG